MMRQFDERVRPPAGGLPAARGEGAVRISPPPSGPAVKGGLPWAKLRRVAAHIDGNLSRELRLVELSGIVHMSPFHFARLFKRATGMPPHRFVTLRRIDRAIDLLDGQDSSVAEIARLVGFGTPSHFATMFRRLTGLTPTEYRAKPR
jgi:AraC family transcriptional regulator